MSDVIRVSCCDNLSCCGDFLSQVFHQYFCLVFVLSVPVSKFPKLDLGLSWDYLGKLSYLCTHKIV